jgi:hypothetical protein
MDNFFSDIFKFLGGFFSVSLLFLVIIIFFIVRAAKKKKLSNEEDSYLEKDDK